MKKDSVSNGSVTGLLRSTIRNEVENSIEVPKGWFEVRSDSSSVYRPRQATLPIVKLHYQPLMVDVDFKHEGKINSKRIRCGSVKEAVDVAKNQLYEWS